MIVNPEIKSALNAIAKQSIKYHNRPSRNNQYLRRIIHVFDNQFTEEERLFILASVLQTIHYRNLAVDPDNMITISNIRLRTLFFVFISTVLLMILAAVLFNTGEGLSGILPTLTSFMRMFSL